MSQGNDRLLSVFSPEGRLYQVEYSFKAVRSEGVTSVGVRGKDAAVVVSQKKVTDRLVDRDSVRHLWRVSERVGCAAVGLPADSRRAVGIAQEISSKWRFKNTTEISVEHLARRYADRAQVNTQEAGARPLGCALLLVGVDDELGPQVFRCDPAGSFSGFFACAIGEKEQEATNALEKKLGADFTAVKAKTATMTKDELVILAITVIQGIATADLTPKDIEVGVCSLEDDRRFHVLDDATVDAYLTQIAEQM